MNTVNTIARQSTELVSADGGGEKGSDAHTVQFYETEEFLCEAVADFLGDGLTVGQPVLAIVTDDHRQAIATRLSMLGFDVDDARDDGRLTFMDALETLTGLMSGSMPDEDLFYQVIGKIIEENLGKASGGTIRVFCQMVDILLREDNPDAAIRLEQLWNQLAERYAFSLLCACAMGSFRRESDAHQLHEICAQHGQVFPAEGFSGALDEETRRREVCILQQRARALETEVQERIRAEQGLRRALDEAGRASRVKSEFLAMMSHELRTPLNAILGYQDLLEHGVGGEVTDAQRTYLNRIRVGAQHLLSIIDQILRVAANDSRSAVARAEPVDAAGLAAKTAELLRSAAMAKGLVLEIQTPRRSITCDTDADKLGQILLNLLSNAVKFTSAGSVTLTVRREAAAVLFQVRDTGPGIESADLSRIFDPFVQVDASATRPHGGTGLGLPVSRDLARALGGQIEVTSSPGAGSTFTLRLPLNALAT